MRVWGEAEPDTDTLVVSRLEHVESRQVQWLWPDRIPLGKLTIIAGNPGLGKSLLAIDIGARVSTGTPFVDCRDTRNRAGSVIVLSAEDDIADTIKPRFEAARANVKRIEVVEGVARFDAEAGRSTPDVFSSSGWMSLPGMVSVGPRNQRMPDRPAREVDTQVRGSLPCRCAVAVMVSAPGLSS